MHYIVLKWVYFSSTKMFKGHGSGVYEIVSDFNMDAYRAVYVVNLDDCFIRPTCVSEKSKSGIKTPKPDLNIIEARLKQLKMALQRGEL